MSPLRLPPLVWIGKSITQKVHGNLRSKEGYLLTKTHFIEEEEEWRLGQAYLGLLGLPLYVAIWFCVQHLYEDVGYWEGNRHVLGHWSNMPSNLRILIAIDIASFLIGFVSIFRTLLVWTQIGRREDIGL
jgi:hypothetical protein